MREVEEQKENAGNDVDDGHDGDNVHRDFCNALETADDDGCCKDRDEEACDCCGDAHGVSADVDKFSGVRGEASHGARDAVDLRDGANAEEACAHTEDGKDHGEPFHVPAEAFLDTRFNVIERTTENLAFLIDCAVLDGEQAFGILCCHAEECGDFHPEKGARATGADCGCHTDDVTRTDCGGESRAERSEAGYFACAVFFAVRHEAECVVQVHDLQTAESDGEEDAYKEDDDNEGNAPDVPIDSIENGIESFHK